MTNFDEYTYTVGDYLLGALFNDDITGLEGHEIEALERFLDSDLFLKGHWAMPDRDQYPDFDRCDITGTMGNCVQVSFFKLIEEN